MRRHVTDAVVQNCRPDIGNLSTFQLETINRLLKKQSRPRTKRTTAQSREQQHVDDVTPPGSTSGVRSNSGPNRRGARKAAAAGGGEDSENDAGVENAMDTQDHYNGEKEVQRQAPTMYRWVSSACRQEVTDGSTEMRMRITFSVPVSVLPSNEDAGVLKAGKDEEDGRAVRPERPATCAAPGCQKPFRYRLVKDWTRGACGMACLKALEATS
jgi:Ino eighty subunit 2